MSEYESARLERQQKEDWYAAGSDGTVISCLCKGGKGLAKSWRLKKPTWSGKKGKEYPCTGLYRKGKTKRLTVASIVCLAFIGPKPPKMDVRHYPDRSHANSRIDNLSYCTRKQNMADKKFHGTSQTGINNWKSRINTKTRCAIPDCDREHCAKGYCEKHWRQWKKGTLKNE